MATSIWRRRVTTLGIPPGRGILANQGPAQGQSIFADEAILRLREDGALKGGNWIVNLVIVCQPDPAQDQGQLVIARGDAVVA